MSDKKAAPAKEKSVLPTAMMVIVALIAATFVTLAMIEPKKMTSATEETTTMATQAQSPDLDERGFDKSLLVLVNTWNPTPEGYGIELVPLVGGNLSVAKVAYDDLMEMLMDGMAEGFYFQVVSAYRGRGEQELLFEEEVQRFLDQGNYQGVAEAEAALHTPRAMHSDHHTGLAVDILASTYPQMDAAQALTAETKWLHEHCHEYGFILRYPDGMEGETGIYYKPWHYRYVGREAAAFLTEHNLTLEEYWRQYGSVS